jgi:hypothetical protein
MSKTTIPTGGITADAINATLVTDDAISDEHLDVTAVTGQTAITSLADTDKFLVSDASDSGNLKYVEKQYLPSGTLVKTAAVDFESGTGADTVELQNCFNTTYDSYYFVIRRYLPEDDGDDFRFRCMTGTNTQVSSNDYNYGARYFDEDGNASSNTGASQSFFRIADSVTNIQANGGLSATLFITLDRTDSSGNAFRFSGSGGFDDGSDKNHSIHMSGMLNDSTANKAVTGIVVFPGNQIRKIHMTCYGITE